jgi:outer membrane protein OmpA-like peptidoglycan-associated protein
MVQKNSKTLVLSLLLGLFVFSSCGPKPEPDVLTLEYLRSLSDEELKARDSDGDGLSDYDELYTYNTNPLSPDTDGDGLNDADEVRTYETDPLNPDTDGDGLNDGDEVNAHETDPLNPDTDGDGLTDGAEVNTHNTDPTNADTDGDGLNDGAEVNTHNTDPVNPDSDGDDYPDGWEVENGFNPLDDSDPGRIRELNTIYFGFDRSNITTAAAQALADNVEQLISLPNFRVRVDAYTDHVGGDQYNLRLSLRRANSVVEFYRNNGVSEDRIESRGLGKAPVPCLASEKDADTPGCQRNRRAESAPLNPYGF